MAAQDNEIRELRKQVNKLSNRVSALTRMLQKSMTGVLSVADAALIGYYSEDYLYKLIAMGEIQAYRPTPKRLFIDWEDFVRFIKTNPTK